MSCYTWYSATVCVGLSPNIHYVYTVNLLSSLLQISSDMYHTLNNSHTIGPYSDMFRWWLPLSSGNFTL